ncbi:hypothetical protein R3P38DRAFT_1603941 [Favolaschia claudopus]|uniref:Uncharacterized protein n=1 Tax=Favolaschia claudopus TaxID=2862362 RepID=A0AAW0AGW2_9AGAR
MLYIEALEQRRRPVIRLAFYLISLPFFFCIEVRGPRARDPWLHSGPRNYSPLCCLGKALSTSHSFVDPVSLALRRYSSEFRYNALVRCRRDGVCLYIFISFIFFFVPGTRAPVLSIS